MMEGWSNGIVELWSGGEVKLWRGGVIGGNQLLVIVNR